MATDGQLPNNDEIFDALRDKAASSGVDTWTLKIYRRPSQNIMQMKHIATLGQATLQQIISAENWIPLLAGGGPNIVMECFHATDMNRAVKGRLNFLVDGDPAPIPNHAALEHPAWNGPKKWIGPIFDGQPGTAVVPVWSSPPVPAVGGPQRGNVAPTPGLSGISDPRVDVALGQLTQQVRELEDMKRRTEIERVERLAAEKERESNRRIEEQAREHKREIEELRKSVAAPKTGPVEVVAGLTPLVQMWMENMKTEREERRRADEREREERRKSEEREREDRRRSEEARAAQAAEERRRSDMLFQKLLEPKPLLDPTLEKFIVKRDDPSAGAEVLAKVSGSMMRLMQFAMSAVQDKDPENPTTAMVKEVVNGLQGFLATMQPPQIVQQVIGQPAVAPAAAAQPVQPQPANGGTGPQKPIDVNDPKVPILHRLVERIKRLDDVKAIAVDFCDACDETIIKDDSLRVALKESNGDAPELFRKYVGEDFAIRNQTYALNLGKAIEAEWNREEEEAEVEAEVVRDNEEEAQAEA